MAAHQGSRGAFAPRRTSRGVPPSFCVRAQGGASGASSNRIPLSMPKSNSSSSASASSLPATSSPPAALSARISRFLSAAPPSSDLPPKMYSRALALCREQDYERAFAVFERVVCLQPGYAKAWVSWAQAEKRAMRGAASTERNSSDGGSGDGSSPLPSSAVAVLQAGLSLNRRGPPSARAPLAQAWALHELQRGNSRAAVALLARAVREDPERCSPVLRWAPVVEAAREAAEERERKKGGGGRKKRE